MGRLFEVWDGMEWVWNWQGVYGLGQDENERGIPFGKFICWHKQDSRHFAL